MVIQPNGSSSNYRLRQLKESRRRPSHDTIERGAKAETLEALRELGPATNNPRTQTRSDRLLLLFAVLGSTAIFAIAWELMRSSCTVDAFNNQRSTMRFVILGLAMFTVTSIFIKLRMHMSAGTTESNAAVARTATVLATSFTVGCIGLAIWLLIDSGETFCSI